VSNAFKKVSIPYSIGSTVTNNKDLGRVIKQMQSVFCKQRDQWKAMYHHFWHIRKTPKLESSFRVNEYKLKIDSYRKVFQRWQEARNRIFRHHTRL